MNRVGIAFFYDDHGVIDEYMFHLVQEMGKFTSRMIFISNGPLLSEHIDRINASGWELIIRDNIGFDVWAYKTAIEYIGYDNLDNYDELLLFNHTFYGPIYPFEEMFGAMDAAECDFWGITAHKELVPNPFTGKGYLPWHLNSHFIAVRRPMLTSTHFRYYWQNMPMITSYSDSVVKHESRFSSHFTDIGYRVKVYDDDEKYDSPYPCFINIDEALENRCPILKRRLFFHDPGFLETHAVDLPRALRIMNETSDYDEGMIWHNIARAAELRTLNANAGLTSVFPDTRLLKNMKRSKVKKIAVCAHVYYTDMVGELLACTKNINVIYDFIATTDTDKKKAEIEAQLKGVPGIGKVIVRVLEVNRGRDMSSLFIACRDLFLEDKYDLVCRLHTKRTPQVETSRSNLFKRHLFENLLASEGYVDNVIDMFEAKPWVGMAIPPAVHIGFGTLGLGWFVNKPRTQELVKELDLKIKVDEDTPIAVFGTMFWFRPKALRKLFEHPWKWEDFNEEPNHIDGGLAHVLERLICYVAQGANYTIQQVMSETQAGFNYAVMEYKFQKLSSFLPAIFLGQVDMLRKWRDPSFVPPYETNNSISFNQEWHAIGANEVVEKPDLIAQYHEGRKMWRGSTVSPTSHEPKFADLEKVAAVLESFMLQAGSVYWKDGNIENIKGNIYKYLISGWYSGEDIFCLFDTDYYLSKNPDVVSAGMNPFFHYIMHGAAEGRQPHPLFNPQHYQGRFPDIDFTATNPILHFLTASEAIDASPHPLFDTSLYLSWYPGVKDAGMNALGHYLKYGATEDRWPHIMFNPQHYRSNLAVTLTADINPLVHYVEVGANANINPHPLFDIAYYRMQFSEPLQAEPLSHFMAENPAETRDPHPLFDCSDYISRYESVLATGMNPLEHYIKIGSSEKFRAHVLFDSKYYDTKYPEVSKAGMDTLIHFVCHGCAEKRDPLPEFDMKYYMRTNSDVARSGHNSFIHFIKHGWREQRNPNPNFDTAYYVSQHPEVANFNALAFYIRFGRDRGDQTTPNNSKIEKPKAKSAKVKSHA